MNLSWNEQVVSKRWWTCRTREANPACLVESNTEKLLKTCSRDTGLEECDDAGVHIKHIHSRIHGMERKVSIGTLNFDLS